MTKIWLLFFLGQVLYITKRASLIISSPKNTEVNSVLDHLKVHGWAIAWQTAVGAGLLMVWAEAPYLFALATGKVFNGVPALPLVPGTAFLFGLFWQVIMDFIEEKYRGRVKDQEPSQ